MSATRYEVFCRYLNGSVNKCVTNQTNAQWVNKENYMNLTTFYSVNKPAYDKLKEELTRPTNARHRSDFTAEEENIYSQCLLYEQYKNAERMGLFCPEICDIEPVDHLYNDTYGALRRAKMKRDIDHLDTIVKETDMNNPKYDMIFLYDGLAKVVGSTCLNPPPQDKHQAPYVYFDRMKRVNFDVWFLHSVHGSLISAMNKANELINIMGKQSVKIGKVVPLDKYIEIV